MSSVNRLRQTNGVPCSKIDSAEDRKAAAPVDDYVFASRTMWESSHSTRRIKDIAPARAFKWRPVGILICRLLNAREIIGGVCVSVALVSCDSGVRAKRSRQRCPLSLSLGIGPDLAAGDQFVRSDALRNPSI